MEGSKLGSIQFVFIFAMFLSQSMSAGGTYNSTLDTASPTTQTVMDGQDSKASSVSPGDVSQTERSQEMGNQGPLPVDQIDDSYTALSVTRSTEPPDVYDVLNKTEGPSDSWNFLGGSEESPRFYLKIPDCQQDNIEFSGVGGEIQGLVASEDMGRILLNASCVWSLTVPAGMLAVAELSLTSDPCPHQLDGRVYSGRGSKYGVFSCMQTELTIWSESQQIRFQLKETHHVYKSKELPEKYPEIRIRFTAVPEPTAHEVNMELLSVASDYTSRPYYMYIDMVGTRLKGEYQIGAPKGHFTMISFPLFPQAETTLSCNHWLIELLAVDAKGNSSVIWRYCELPSRSLPATVYNTSLTIQYDFFGFISFRGFKILFSFHPETDGPRQLKSGLLDCSGPDYTSFKQHLLCNLEVECGGGEDEGEHCSFSPPGCRGKVGYKDRCYSLVFSEKPVTWLEADERCREDGGTGLAMMKTEAQWQAFRDLFRYGKLLPETLIGLTHYNSSMPDMYRYTYQWADGTVLYDRGIYLVGKLLKSPPRYQDSKPDWIVIGKFIQTLDHFACQFNNPEYVETDENRQTTIPQLSSAAIVPSGASALSGTLRHRNLTLVLCPLGHVTHHFLSRDLQAQCTSDQPRADWRSDSVAMFVCENGRDPLPYTLVCDFRRHCLDGSDETFCRHEDCQDFACTSGQCVSKEKRCDMVTHCLDGSDEESCGIPTNKQYNGVQDRLSAPALVYFHDNGSFTMKKMDKLQSCPDTHFRCPGTSDYCLPTYVRCNGVYDCLGHEDEEGCQNYTCPGFYRCRASSVCVHLDHLCDGWPQCPQRDDELLCDFTCPQGCHCQGLAFVCHEPFPAENYPQLRYLDASGSGMTPDDVSSNGHLVFLSLSSCQLDRVQDITLNNLKTLNLRHNLLRTFRLDSLLSMENLEVLILAGNPLASLFTGKSDTRRSRLKVLDISHTGLLVLDGTVFQSSPAIQFLNVSFTSIETIAPFSFLYLPQLTGVDMRGLFPQDYPDGLLKGLGQLQEVSADDYRLCCENILPEHFDGLCLAPEGDFSTCQQLLGSDMFRVFVWTVGLLAVAGNVCCAVKQVLLPRVFDRGIGVMTFTMHLANCATGVYFLMLGVGDQVLAGGFMYHERSWRRGAMCHVAGFLWLSSGQATLLLVFLITLDRLVMLTFPSDLQPSVREQAGLANKSSNCDTSMMDPKTPVTQSAGQLSSKSSAAQMSVANWGKTRSIAASPLKELFMTKWFSVAVCLAVLTVSTMLASVPFFPPNSHWQFYSQTTLCLPLSSAASSPHDHNSFFLAVILLSFLLSLFIAVGQCRIYRSVRMAIRHSDLEDLPQDATIAKRLISVSGMVCLCWFCIGLEGIMVRAGVSEMDGLFKSLVLYLVPLNAAINPLVYSYNVAKEKQRALEKARLLVSLRSRVTSLSAKRTASHSQ